LVDLIDKVISCNVFFRHAPRMRRRHPQPCGCGMANAVTHGFHVPTTRRALALLLLVAAGCQTPRATMPALVEQQVAAVAPVRATLGFMPCTAAAPLDLPALWQLAVSNNPSLREAAADVETARGLQLQARKYPNPHFLFQQDTIGSRAALPGNMTLQVSQEIITGGKRRLDMAIAGRETDAAFLGLLSRKFEVMTRIRRAYYAYLGAVSAAQLNDAAVASLQTGVATTRKLVEKVQNRPRTDLLRLEALLEETKINQSRSRFQVEAAWKQVAAEVGVLDLPMPAARGFSTLGPPWNAENIWQRVQAANTALQQARVEAERARLGVERARAEAVPNFTVGAGYTNDAVDSTAGAVVSVETALPLWDRKQGHIRAAEAGWVKAEAAVRTLETTLSATTAAAFARYQGARHQVEKLDQEVLPRLQESLDLLLKSYEIGAAGVVFGDVLMTEQSLITTRLTLAEARQSMWQAIADLQGLMQLDIDVESGMQP
jgi:cobalt-zinc-cadmium efflux system outer membrane protein